ncbi:glycine cleavage system H protein-like [Panonychus citri]|uniref:glycine cleavage system H protein-like n=1 Tax=Panonychus citri TaxID=50023 RepID=UPI0023078FF6|nr:glycine cleavage system H protein-like [Panonychus citri]XP_053206242.1 glycine cleavage system H protein-like [Panonychus citri]
MYFSKLTKSLISFSNVNCFNLMSTTKWINVLSNQPAFSNCLASSNQLRKLSLSVNRFSDRRYHDKHEWVTISDNVATVGISDYAQKALGDIVFAELPEIGREVEKDDEVGCVESTKSANDIYSPLRGEVVAVNEKLESEPHLLNTSPYDQGWIYKMKVPNEEEFSRLMDEKQYENFIKIQQAGGSEN